MAAYHLPASVIALTFLGVILWEGTAATLLWWCARGFDGAAGGVSPGAARVYLAFGVTIALWLAFMFMEEVFLQYATEGTHVQLLIGALVTVLFLVQLPD
jgi:hypothetical protein